MPRYYFNFTDGKRTFTDSVGVELSGIVAAQENAIAQIRDMRASLSERKIQDWLQWRMMVLDERGEKSFEVGFDLLARPGSLGPGKSSQFSRDVSIATKNDILRRDIIFTILKAKHEWFVVLPDKTQLGPYRNAGIVLGVAVTQVLLACRRGLDARITIQDEFGGIHNCMLIDWSNNPDCCLKCETNRQTSSLPVECPLHAAISAQ